jgi:hypothetical protein
MSNINDILKQLDLGILPYELNYSERIKDEIDWEKVKYNTFYKEPQYFLNRFPNQKAFMNLPGFNEVLKDMVDNVTSPLEEILERQNENKILNNNINNGMVELSQITN